MSVFSEAIGDEQYADEQDESQQDAPHLSLVLHGCHPYLVEEVVAGYYLHKGPQHDDRGYGHADVGTPLAVCKVKGFVKSLQYSKKNDFPVLIIAFEEKTLSSDKGEDLVKCC